VTRIHIISLPHTQLTQAHSACAYSMKVVRLVKMLDIAGHESFVYGPDQHECQKATEYIPIVFPADRKAWFGAEEWDTRQVFDHWDTEHVSWRTMNTRAATAIRQRWQSGDILGVIAGRCQQQLRDELADLKPLTVEWGIGYSGVLNGTHKVFESYAWAHHVAGLSRVDDIQYFDDVIPNCFDPADLQFNDTPGEYLLYLGRPTPRKGLPIIAELATRVDIPIIIAGQPGPDIPGTRHVGLVTGDEKAELLAGARALLSPTSYLEPFGGSAVEAMLSGTPVIATDWGAFTETVTNGVTGYRCRMLREFTDAVTNVTTLDRHAIREHAMARWTIDVGATLYSDYLERVSTLYGDGWYT
jgi:hypothetical protein